MKKVFLVSAHSGSPFDATKFHNFVLSLHPTHIASWWHYLPGSTYLVKTDLNTEQINSLFLKHMSGLQYLVIKVDRTEFSGWLPPAAWDWINSD